MTEKPVVADKQQQKTNKTGRIIKSGLRKGFRTTRNGARLTWDLTKSLIGVGQRRVNRRSNRTTTGRYLNDLITTAETTHLAGQYVDLSKVLVEPRFYAEPEIYEPVDEDDVRQEVYYVIPRIFKYPYLTAPYNLPTYRIPQLEAGHRRLAILGLPGSGKTTALMAIALWVLREIQFEEPDDPVKQKIREEDAQLTDKERKEKEYARQRMVKEAQEELENAIESGEAKRPMAVNAAEAAAEEAEEVVAMTALLPIIVHCADLHITASEFNGEVDPAEPLVRAVQQRVSTLTARTIPEIVYKRLEQNRALILMDGYDDLPVHEQEYVLAWLNAFLDQYGKNFLIMTAPVVGYGKLTRLNITPIFIKPWNQQEVERFVDGWSTIYPQINQTKRRKETIEISNSQIKRAKTDAHALSPAELMLKAWGTFQKGDTNLYLDEWIRTFTQKHLESSKTNVDDMDQFLKILATLQTEFGFITRHSIETLVAEQETSGGGSVSSEALQEVAEETESGEAESGENEETESDDEFLDEGDEESVKRGQMLRELVFSGLLVAYRGRRYQFRHQILSDYFASLVLTDMPENDPATLYDLAQRPAWQRPLMFAAMHTDLTEVVKMRLLANPDITRSALIDMARWLAYVKDPQGWHEEVITRLGNALVHPQQFTANREIITAALVGSRHIDGALRIFDYGLRQNDIELQLLCCLGIGAMGRYGRRFIPQLSTLMFHETEEVQLAAAHALAGLDTQDAKEALVQALLEGGERLQQAAAESFAAMPNEGYLTLYEAVEHPDMQIRRVALFGMRRVETEWGQDVIRRRFLQEDEWYARVVAQETFLQNASGLVGPQPNPEPDEIEWIRLWAEDRNKKLTHGKQSYAVLTKTLGDYDPSIRAMGAVVLGQMGIVEAIKPLYGNLTDPDRIVSFAAHGALVNLEQKLGHPIQDPL